MVKTLEQKIGQLIIAGFRDNTISKETDIINYIRNYNISGVILYDEDMEKGRAGSRNIISQHQLKTLTSTIQDSTKSPLFISIDQEGGRVNRLKEEYGFPSFQSWKSIGDLDEESETEKITTTLADCLSDCGINLNYAPVLDFDYGKSSYIGNSDRALSKNPDKIIKHSSIFIKNLKEKNIISCVKHFPGQGSGFGDTHKGITDITETWSKEELLPYEIMIKNNEIDMVMISHVFHRKYDDKLPASLSKKITTDLLREKLHFRGVVICDDPSMKAISNNYSIEDTFSFMINAGIDMFCLGNNLDYDVNYIPKCIDAIISGIKKGKISMDLIDSSITRINSLKSKI